MRYWDTSAVIPLLIAESSSARMRNTLAADPAVVTWWATQIECVSTFARLGREGRLSPGATVATIARLRAAAAMWTELGPSSDLREQAFRLVRVHQLRASDAIQLAAAIIASDFQPGALEFVTLDSRQAEAADKEGFRVIA